MSKDAQYSFPNLKASEIVSCLTELGMPLTIAQLNDPKEEEITPVFYKLLELLKGISREELRQLDFRGIEMLPYPELHEDSIVEMGSLKEMIDLCQKTGLHDIGLNDLVIPEKQRLKRILSALINFAKFREDKLEVFSQHTQQSQQLLELRASEEAATEELERQRAQMSEQHEQIKPQILAVQNEAEQLQGQLHALVTEQAQLREEMREIKAVSSELAQGIQEKSVEILAVQTENSRIKAQIIPEPEKLKQSLKDMTNTMHANRADLSAQAAKLKQTQAIVGQKAKLEEKLQKRVELLRSFQTEQHAVAKLRKVLAEQAEKEHELLSATNDLNAQEESLKENLSQAQEKLFSLQTSFEAKRLTAQQALEQVTQEKDALSKLLASAKSQSEQNESVMAMKKQQLQSIQTEHTRTMGNLRGKYVTLQQAVGEYHEKLAIVMNQA